jgi:hypothetical protein
VGASQSADVGAVRVCLLSESKSLSEERKDFLSLRPGVAPRLTCVPPSKFCLRAADVRCVPCNNNNNVRLVKRKP